MDQPIDRTGSGSGPEPGTEPCAKTTLGPVVRTALLLAGAVLASILAVDLPIADRAEQAYVPASPQWIELGAENVSETPPLQRS